MVTYTVHEMMPPPQTLRDRAEKIRFVREGWSWPALVFGLPWLLVRGLWLEFLVIFGGAVVVGSVLAALTGSTDAAAWPVFGLGILLALEIHNLERWKLEQRGYQMVSIVTGRNFDEAERRFFYIWSPSTPADPPPAALKPSLANLKPGEPQVIGFLGSDRA
jgi:hypothetical protein